jgi:hypothetical protein
MADIFSSNPGVVSVFQSPGTPMSFFLEGWGGFPGFRSIVTGFQATMQGGVQFMHTLRDFIYIYVFGERIATVVISGLSFHQQCPGGDGSHGLESVFAYYGAGRVEARAGPIVIVFGTSTVFLGFLTQMQGTLQDPDKRVATFSLQFQAVPG